MKKIKLLALAAMLVSMLCFGCKQAAQTKPSGNKQIEPPAPPSQGEQKPGQDEQKPGQDEQKPGPDEQKPGQDEQKPGQDEQKPDQGQTPPANTDKITKATPIGAGNQFAYFNIKIEPENVLTEIDMVMFGNKNGIKENSKYQTWGKDLSFFVDTDTDKTVYIKEPQDGTKISFKDKTGNILGTFKYRKITKTLEKVNP